MGAPRHADAIGIPQASADFDAFMKDLVATSMIQTSHQAYTMLQAVLQVFSRSPDRRPGDCVRQCPATRPARIFVSDWDTEAPVKPFVDRDALMKEVRAFRHDHNLSTDTALEDVTVVIRRHVDQAAFERILNTLPPDARRFWYIGQA